jgi:nitrate/nitrite-specific signal transduction histidine kinase
MVSMRERAEAIGARLRVESAPGQGTCVIVEAPRAAPASADQPHLPGIEPA